MCKKQTAVSDNSTESEIISLDAGLRMGWMPALDLWYTVIEILRSTNNNVQPKHTSHQEIGADLDSKTKAQHVKRKQQIEQLNEVDYVPHQHTHSSQGESQLCIFQDNEAVIKMIIVEKFKANREESQPAEPPDDAEARRDLVCPKWLHLSSSQWTKSSTPRAEGRNIPYSTEITLM